MNHEWPCCSFEEVAECNSAVQQNETLRYDNCRILKACTVSAKAPLVPRAEAPVLMKLANGGPSENSAVRQAASLRYEADHLARPDQPKRATRAKVPINSRSF